MPQLKQRFTVNHARPLVWARFQDLPNVVQCIPGASLTDQASATQAKGRMTVKLGPIKADFGGDVEIEADESSYTGKIIGSGIDKSHASRAKGNVVYTLQEAKDGAATLVNVDVDYTLSGSLAQVARGGIVEAVAEQICQEFARNLEEQLNATLAPVAETGDAAAQGAAPAARPAPAKPNELNALKLIMAIIRSKLRGMFGSAAAR
jgi:carbon monoxide dehydrogenase subunit G